MRNKVAMGPDMVGRPSNGTKQYGVQLTPELVARLDAFTDKNYKRSEFIRDAIERELERRGK